ncbi:outer membrane lipoprotein carrier protein LolA [Yoonia sp.]|uniref:LolA family protein n=1 Tax=Yoonia sp. TaxID=2212373 RepID=UPI001A094006|nr:outer membrane lipoprotein carrier protein LolA [Yoonia sp.]MBE0412236.1 outer membrane lipoprotein carrier protein LolA [Yoonia sp.]
MMKRILFTFAVVALAIYAGAATAQQLSLAQISQYLNQLETAQGRFTQVNPDGSQIAGTIYIKRPGRIRFEYDPPERSMVIAGGGQLAVFDPRSNTGPDRYPLNQTPLNVILQRDVNLERARMVTGQSYDGTYTTVTARDPDNAEYGAIQLVFSANPIALRQWVITDDIGTRTTVVLGDLVTGGRIGDILFNIRAEMRKWGN